MTGTRQVLFRLGHDSETSLTSGRDPLYDGRVWLHRLVSDPRLGLGAGEQERALGHPEAPETRSGRLSEEIREDL